MSRESFQVALGMACIAAVAGTLTVSSPGCLNNRATPPSHWPSYELPLADDPPKSWTGNLSVVVGRSGRHPGHVDGSLAHVRVRRRNGDVWFDGTIPWTINTINLRLPPDDYEVKVDEHPCARSCRHPARAKSWCESWVKVKGRDRTDLYAEFREPSERCEMREYLRSVEEPPESVRLVFARSYEDPEMTKPWRLCLGTTCNREPTPGGDPPLLDYMMPASVRSVELVTTPTELLHFTGAVAHTDDIEGITKLPRDCTVWGSAGQCADPQPRGSSPRRCVSRVPDVRGRKQITVSHRVTLQGGCIGG